MRMLLILGVLLCASGLCAEEYLLETEVGIGGTPQAPGLVAGPFAPLTVHIQRTDARPFKGRVVVELAGRSRRRGGGPFGDDPKRVELVQELNLDDGTQHAAVRFELPAFGSLIEGQATLEVAVGNSFEPVAAKVFSGSVRTDNRVFAAFVSQARLSSAQPFLFQELVEIQPQHLPDTWKLLSCFDVIILNDDRLTRKQADALVDYVVSGGNLLVSPNAATAFNPELPLARLIGATGGGGQSSVKLSEFKALREPPKPSGMSRSTGGGRGGIPEGSPEGEAPLPGPEEPPVMPDDGAELILWGAAGRARNVEDMSRLLSYARVGAGTVALLHADLSQYPLVTTGARKPTAAGINLLSGALKFVARGVGRNPLSRLATPDPRDSLEIAGKRIPNRDLQALLIFLYVGAAGVGMFLLARRIKRPEFYPGALLALALLSVLLVFSLGEVYKRTGDRARAVRLVVSDGVTNRNAVFSIGCAYIVDQSEIEFAQDRVSWLIPAGLGGSGSRGLPADYLEYSAQISAVESVTTVSGLDRWQNVFFASAEPAAVADLQLRLFGDGGSYTVENRSPHKLSGCLVLIGGAASGPGTGARCEWHYVPAIGAVGTADERVPLSKATRAPADGNDIAAMIAADGGDSELAAALSAALLGVSEHRRLRLPREHTDLERMLEQSDLLPEEGEYLVLALLPDDAVSKGSLGLRGLEPDRIGQAVLWATRGLLESR